MSMSEVPVIDVSPYYHGGEDGKRAVAQLIDKACTEIGFLQLVGHPVPAEVIARVYDTSKAFFDLPTAEKLRLKRPAADQVRGYSPLEDEGLSYSLDEPSPGDLKESLTIGPVDVPAGDPYFTSEAAGPHFAPNLFPDHPPGLKAAWTEYFQHLERFSADVMRMFALGLGLPEHYFDRTIDRHISMFRVLNYPDQQVPPKPHQLRAGAHSDYGSLTLLIQERAPGGLQALNKAGKWIPVPPIEGAFVLNIGDLMAQWTNDKWISTVHRVVNPPRDAAMGSRRQSIVFFHQPNYDAIIEALPTCVSPETPAKYRPITSGDHLRNKFLKQTTQGEAV